MDSRGEFLAIHVKRGGISITLTTKHGAKTMKLLVVEPIHPDEDVIYKFMTDSAALQQAKEFIEAGSFRSVTLREVGAISHQWFGVQLGE